MPALRIIMPMTKTTGTETERLPRSQLWRVLSWFSPSFPVGAFSYSHGLESAAATGAVHDRGTLQGWITTVVTRGSGRIDADILRDTHRAAVAGDMDALTAANRRGVAFRGTAETALEATAQGEAFLSTCRAAWPEPLLDRWAELLGQSNEVPCLAAAVGVATGRASVPLEHALTGYVHAIATNLVSAGLRLGIVGQTDGQRIIAALDPVIDKAVVAALSRDPASFGTATFAVDLASMMHETQYTRIFRS
jgi:urease accessory protein